MNFFVSMNNHLGTIHQLFDNFMEYNKTFFLFSDYLSFVYPFYIWRFSSVYILFIQHPVSIGYPPCVQNLEKGVAQVHRKARIFPVLLVSFWSPSGVLLVSLLFPSNYSHITDAFTSYEKVLFVLEGYHCVLGKLSLRKWLLKNIFDWVSLSASIIIWG